MRKVVIILILSLELLFSYPMGKSTPSIDSMAEEDEALQQTITEDYQEENNDPNNIDDQDDMFNEREILSRKLFQKDLPTMTSREKITWAFRMADSNPFL